MSQAGHLQPDPKGKCSPWKHSSDVRPQNRCFPKYGLLSKIPPPPVPELHPKGGKAKRGGDGEKWSQGEEGRESDSRLASASAKRA